MRFTKLDSFSCELLLRVLWILKLRILLQVVGSFLRPYPMRRIAGVSQLPAHPSTCIDTFLALVELVDDIFYSSLSLPCLAYYLYEYQETDVLDLHTADCRNDGELPSLAGSLQNSESMRCDVLYVVFRQAENCHTHLPLFQQSIPSNVFHCKKHWSAPCPPFPKNGLDHTLLECSYQCASIALGQTPAVSSGAGTFAKYSTNQSKLWTNLEDMGITAILLVGNLPKNVDKLFISYRPNVDGKTPQNSLWAIYQHPVGKSNSYPQSYQQADCLPYSDPFLYLKSGRDGGNHRSYPQYPHPLLILRIHIKYTYMMID